MKKLITGNKQLPADTKRVWVRLTRICNNNCIFCLDKDSHDGSCISYEEIKKKLLDGRREKYIRTVLSGGEPTLHPLFLDIVKFAKKIGYQRIQVITNGRLFIYRNLLKSIVNAGINEITFSIHGHTDILHDRLTRVNGSFKQTISGILNALKINGLIVNADVVITKLNVKYLKDILTFLINLGISEFDLLQVVPFGSAWINKERVFYDIEKSLGYLNKAFLLSKNKTIHLWTNRFPPIYLEGFEYLIQNPQKIYDEVRGRREIFDKYIYDKLLMPCKGERCRYCFLRNFCSDLTALITEGNIRSKCEGFCLNKTKVRHKAHNRVFRFNNKKLNVLDFTEFYIKNRYFLKSLRCKRCRFDKSCEGAHIDRIRNHSFKILTPIE